MYRLVRCVKFKSEVKKMKKIKLTRASNNELLTWHSGSGKMYLSEGTGGHMKYFDVVFIHNKFGYFLAMGNSKGIKLTDEQIKVIGTYSVDDFED